MPAAELAGRGLPERYLLFVGTVEPRKGLPALLSALRLLHDSDEADPATPPLVLAGPPGWGPALETAALPPGAVVSAGYLDTADLRRLVAGAALLAYPSVYEGFGLPPLEAFAAGVPVVASDLPVVREVTGELAALAPVGDARGAGRGGAGDAGRPGRPGRPPGPGARVHLGGLRGPHRRGVPAGAGRVTAPAATATSAAVGSARVRVLAFGTYDVRSHPRVGVLIEGLRASGDDVVEVNVPLGLDTAARVAMLRQPWRLPAGRVPAGPLLGWLLRRPRRGARTGAGAGRRARRLPRPLRRAAGPAAVPARPDRARPPDLRRRHGRRPRRVRRRLTMRLLRPARRGARCAAPT